MTWAVNARRVGAVNVVRNTLAHHRVKGIAELYFELHRMLMQVRGNLNLKAFC